MTTSERLANAMFTKLSEDSWEHSVLPFMQTRIMNEEEKQDRLRYLITSMRAGLIMTFGLLLTTALKPLLMWMSLMMLKIFGVGDIIFYSITFTTFVPVLLCFALGSVHLVRASKTVKFRGILKTSERLSRVSWYSFFNRVGSALGPKPIQIVLALSALCLIGTVLLSSAINDIYLTELVNFVLFLLIVSPAIPAGLRSQRKDSTLSTLS